MNCSIVGSRKHLCLEHQLFLEIPLVILQLVPYDNEPNQNWI